MNLALDAELHGFIRCFVAHLTAARKSRNQIRPQRYTEKRKSQPRMNANENESTRISGRTKPEFLEEEKQNCGLSSLKILLKKRKDLKDSSAKDAKNSGVFEFNRVSAHAIFTGKILTLFIRIRVNSF